MPFSFRLVVVLTLGFQLPLTRVLPGGPFWRVHGLCSFIGLDGFRW